MFRVSKGNLFECIRVATQEAAGTATVSKLLCCDGKKMQKLYSTCEPKNNTLEHWAAWTWLQMVKMDPPWNYREALGKPFSRYKSACPTIPSYKMHFRQKKITKVTTRFLTKWLVQPFNYTIWLQNFPIGTNRAFPIAIPINTIWLGCSFLTPGNFNPVIGSEGSDFSCAKITVGKHSESEIKFSKVFCII